MNIVLKAKIFILKGCEIFADIMETWCKHCDILYECEKDGYQFVINYLEE
jgi:hypothetical protein